MRQSHKKESEARPRYRIDVVERGRPSRLTHLRCEIGSCLEFDTSSLESYFFSEWDPIFYDALLVAAAVEFCDRSHRRPAFLWGREFDLTIPVHDPIRWREPGLSQSLHDLLNFLTGDNWTLSFVPRSEVEPPPIKQLHFKLEPDISAVIPFSNGLDSQAVAGLKSLDRSQKVVLIRLQTSADNRKKRKKYRNEYTAVPFSVNQGEKRFTESSARSRGFNFALVSGLAAHLSKSKKVILPESGQGILGPVLVPVGQIYEDYRCHPLFTKRMEKFFAALLGSPVMFDHPQLWSTKGETLKRYLAECQGASSSWIKTRSCWQQNRQVSVNRKTRHCGICAACMLRRLSVHAAGASENINAYVWENLNSVTFERGAAHEFPEKKITKAMREYAIAGVLYLDHFARLNDTNIDDQTLSLRSAQLSKAIELDPLETRRRMDDLILRHKNEWTTFLNSLDSSSFIRKWARRVTQ